MGVWQNTLAGVKCKDINTLASVVRHHRNPLIGPHVLHSIDPVNNRL
tara:strand:- start:495 stop:635 length:141 start_codon:yes stop_codon:yes gene_type:complete